MFAQAVELQQAGRAGEAEQLHRQVLALQPRHADSLHLLGVLYLQADRPQNAADLIGQAIAIDGRQAQFHNNLGSALRALERQDEAIASFRKALTLRPDYPRALINLGPLLAQVGQSEKGMDVLRRAVALAPHDHEAWSTLGVLLHQQGLRDEAAAAYEQALRIDPASAAMRENLARLHFEQGHTANGIAALQNVLAHTPGSAKQYRFLATALESETRLSEAADAYRAAIRLEPGEARAHNALGNLLAAQGEIDEALASYDRAIRLDPDYLEARSNLLMTLHSSPDVGAEDIVAEARRYTARLTQTPARAFANVRDAERTLRVGYVSADFREHPVGHFLDRVLPAHDPAQIMPILYSDTRFPDAQSDRLCAHAGWRDIVDKPDADVARMIAADEIDILIDLAGHTGSNRLPLFAGRAAPVQASWLGYFGTTGLSAIDHVIADEVVLPEGEEGLFSETPLRIGSPYLCWSPPVADVPIDPSPADAITFGCFNNRAKINGEVIALWARILKRVEGSRLFLKSWSMADARCRAGLVEAFAAHGIVASGCRSRD